RQENKKNDPSKDVEHGHGLCSRLKGANQTPVKKLSGRSHEAAAARSFGGALFFRIDYLPPGVIGVERGDTRGISGRAFAEILFVYVAIIVDDERHDAGVAIFGRVGDEPEATDHVAAHDIVDRAAWRRRTLAGQDLETVTVERLAGAGAITALRCIGNGFTQRARLFVTA